VQQSSKSLHSTALTTWERLLICGEYVKAAGYADTEQQERYGNNSALTGSPLLLLLRTLRQLCPLP